jgi:hypothetical protein
MRAMPSKNQCLRRLLRDAGRSVEGKRQQLFYYSCLIGVIWGKFDRKLYEFAEND